MTANSNWDELRELSDKQRATEIGLELYTLIENVSDIRPHSNDFEAVKDLTEDCQETLDRIKVLVMSRVRTVK